MDSGSVLSSLGSIVALSLLFGLVVGTTGLLGAGAVSPTHDGVSTDGFPGPVDAGSDERLPTEESEDDGARNHSALALRERRSEPVPEFPQRTDSHWDRLPLADERDPGHATVETDRSSVNTEDVERSIIDAVNEYRSANGLEPWPYSYSLASTARAHSFDMYDRNFFAHRNPDGEQALDRWGTDHCNAYFGENLVETYLAHDALDAHGDRRRFYTEQELADATLELWQASEQHDRLLRSEWATAAGVGVYAGEIDDGGYVVYVTLNVCAEDLSGPSE